MTAELATAVLLPCNVVVQEGDDGCVEVAAIDPYALLGIIQNKEGIRDTIETVRSSLKAGLAAL